MKCKCGAELISDGINGMCWECYAKEPVTEKLHTGWICPKCGYVWAVWVEGCSNCNQPKYDTTVTDGTGTNHADKTRP